MARASNAPRPGSETDSIDLRTYLRESRRVSIALVYVTPLFLFYETALRVVDSDVRNAVEQSFLELYWYLGESAGLLQAFVAVIIALSFARVVSHRLPALRLFPAFLVECLLLAILLGTVLGLLTGSLQPESAVPTAGQPLRIAILSSIGAGIYEETLFRLVLLGGLYLLAARVFRMGRRAAFLMALVVSAVAFGGYHHAVPGGEPFQVHAFAFRTVAGILLGLVFAGRGLAVVVYLHALYDVIYDVRVAAWF